MAFIAVYRFTFWDQTAGKSIVCPRLATLRAIKKCNGRNIEESRRLVDDRELDGDGFYHTPPMRKAAN